LVLKINSLQTKFEAGETIIGQITLKVRESLNLNKGEVKLVFSGREVVKLIKADRSLVSFSKVKNVNIKEFVLPL
jgi:hypothetical protein